MAPNRRARSTAQQAEPIPRADATVTRNANGDYLYRALLPRNVVKQALAAMIQNIDYPNAKDSVEDRSLRAPMSASGVQWQGYDIRR